MATLSARRALVGQLIGRHRGRIANTAGDSVLAEFISVLDAIHCAVEIQGALQRANEGEPEERQMRFRIGVNVGDVLAKVYVIICDAVAAFFSRIWVSSWFRLRIGEGSSEQPAPYSDEDPEPSELPAGAAAMSELSADNEVALELALWDSVKDGSPAELESYLEQYPEGTFATLAQTRLEAAALSPAPAPPTTEEAAADALDLAFWNSVKDSNRREELEAYLEQHPTSHFAGLARARLSSPGS